MPYTRVTREQFVMRGREVKHLPTGATFAAQFVNWGRCGAVLPNGDDFDQDEVVKLAHTILIERELEQAPQR